ncbi:alpha/beta hydrolase [Alteromonas sp. 1_MG-2023]|uniref:alpha/beta hydrolase n=1 Tax=Alteromonas sp. 1_MG-2023 TaxID=3062669 RepID=UPI0026E30316|nr:alpha/beta hydrolase [Alteromonas sp. 1_MG-2023]MDO6477912.1 alpha/beta hydrolase [Alteromonas sp. 1_MG-2023]
MHKLENPLKYCRYGSNNGRIVFYFHGAPGAPEEAGIFDLEGKNHDLTFICLERFSVDSSIIGEAYYKALATEVSKIASGKEVDFVGFSIGAFIAVQVIRYMPGGIGNLYLVSAAAPLEAGSYLDAMAGKQVFRLAQAAPTLFMLVSYWQGLLCRLSPNSLFRMLFFSAAGEDKLLASNHEFRTALTKVMKACFVGLVRGYVRDIGLYVQPWKASLSEISVNTHIWHGAEDNWSPPPMADYLGSAIPGCTSTEIFKGLSHYSCLYQAVPSICDRLGNI